MNTPSSGSAPIGPGDWQRIEAIFHELADEPPGPGRDHNLAVRCGGDTRLAEAVQALLDQDSRLDTAADHADPHLGMRLGSYEVTSLIADPPARWRCHDRG